MAYNTREIGKQYEEMAAKHLEEKGYKILETNFQIRGGEIDIIAEKGDMLSFVEVKYRLKNNYGHPLETVTLAKQKHICRTALRYMNMKKLSYNRTITFDVIAINGSEIIHLENAFPFVGARV